MTPLLALLPLPPMFTTVCPSGCPHASLQEAVDSVADGGTAIISIDAQILDGGTRIDGDKTLTVVPFLTPVEIGTLLQAAQSGDLIEALQELDTLESVTLTHSASTGAATLAVDGGSLTLLGMAVDGGLTRAVDSTDTDLTMLATTIFGRGVVSKGGLVRVQGGSLTVTGGGFQDGSAAGQGGLIAATDADVSLALTSLTNGSAAYGACLFVESTDPLTPRSVVLDQTSFRSCESSLVGGAVLLEGPIQATLSDSTILDSTSANGGGLALVGADLTATVATSAIDGCLAFADGGGVYVDGAQVTIDQGSVSRSSAFFGGGVAVRGGGLVLDQASLDANSALFDGGAVHVQGGTYQAVDSQLTGNVSDRGNGGALWIGDGSTWLEDVRSTMCGNLATSGGAIRAELTEPATLHNLRLLDNIADVDGGGLSHTGAPLNLSFANLLGNSAGRGSGAAVLTSGEMTLDNALVAYNLGSVAIVPRTANARVLIGPTLWFGNERGDLDGLSPTDPGALFANPVLDRYVPGDNCLLAQDWPTWNSPMRDAGTPDADHQDPDGTRADIGAYGGPLADLDLWETDRDLDGVPQIYDCDEGNPDVNPGAVDEPYDGIDADCRFDDDFDADGDGFRPLVDGGEDCDDLDPDVFPGAEEDPNGSVDGNCDGRLDADGDGFERATFGNDVAEPDCDDSNAAIYPGAPELGSDADYNCDGFVDGPRIYRLSGCQTAPSGAASSWLAPLSRRR
jgi:hypothetical protein